MDNRHDANTAMSEPKEKQKGRNQEPQRIKLTARVLVQTYDAIRAIQSIHRVKTGRALPQQEVIDAAILAYAEEHHINGRP